MNKLLLLSKIDFMGSFGIGKSKKQANKTFKTIFIIISIFGLLLSTIYNGIFSFTFKEANESQIYALLLFAGLASFLTFSTGITRVKGIFIGKDYEMLSAMPIKKSYIITSKLISLYLVELFYSVIILLPTIIFTTLFSKDPIFILYGFLAMIFSSCVPLMLSTVIAAFIALIADRFKFGNIISIFFYVVFFSLMILAGFFMSNSVKETEEGIDASSYIMISNIARWANPANKFIELAYYKNQLFIFIYVISSVIFTFLVIYIISLAFPKIHSIINNGGRNEVYAKKELKNIGQGKAIFKQDLRRLFKSKMYLINCILAGVMTIIFCAGAGFALSSNGFLDKIKEGKEIVEKISYSFAIIAITFSISIATPSQVAISMEGKNFWIVKSLPIDYKTYLKNKIYISMILLTPFIIVASILFCILSKQGWFGYVAIPLVSISYLALYSIIGLRMNLRKYRFDWNSEQECLKNSTAQLFSMLIDWGIMITSSGWLIAMSILSPYIAAPVAFVVVSFIFYILFRNTIKTADERIRRIEI